MSSLGLCIMAFDIEDRENVHSVKQWHDAEIIPSVGEYIDLNNYAYGYGDDTLWRVEGIVHNRDLDMLYLHVRKIEDAYENGQYATHPKVELFEAPQSDSKVVINVA